MRYLSGVFCFVCCVFFSFGVAVSERVVPYNKQDVMLSYAPVVKQVAPAVVNIYTKRVVQQQRRNPFYRRSPLMNDPFFQHFFEGRPMRKRVESSLGSGVILSADGLMVSNAHVVRGAEEITAVFSDGREYQAKIVLKDERTDLAILQIETNGDKLPYVTLADSDKAEIGDIVLAIGNPFGVGQTVTGGIVSAISRAATSINDFNFFIQTDAAINPGNSGGALVGMDGKVIGVNTAIYSRDGGSLGIGFAVPSNMVRVVADAAQSGDQVKRAWLGVSTQKVSADIAQSLGLKRPKGALVTGMHDLSPAEQAGLKVGDLIVSLNGKEVDEPASMRFRSALLDIGDDIVLGILRKGVKKEIRFKSISAPEDVPRDTATLKGNHPFNGAVVENLSPAVIEELGTRRLPVIKGVIVRKVLRPLRFGVKAGDIVHEVNSQKIKTVKDLKKAIEKPSRFWSVQINRGGQMLNIRISG